MSLYISLQSSKVSLTQERFRPTSCRQRLREYARQWTVTAAGCSALIFAATPFRLPCIFTVPSYA